MSPSETSNVDKNQAGMNKPSAPYLNAAGQRQYISHTQSYIVSPPNANNHQSSLTDKPIVNASVTSINTTSTGQPGPSRRNLARAARPAQPQTNLTIKDILTQLGPDATVAMLNQAEEAFMAAGSFINVDDVLPFHQAAALRSIGTTMEDMNAAEVLLSFTLSEEAVEEALDKGIGELRARARARKMAEGGEDARR